jgi:hypothetical protein
MAHFTKSESSGFRVQGSGFRVRVQGLGFSGSGFRVKSSEVKV